MAPVSCLLVQRIRYRVAADDGEQGIGHAELEERRLLRALGVAGFAAANVMLLSISIWAGIDGEMGWATRDLMHWVSALIALPALVYAGRPFFGSAWRAVTHGRTNMDVPISVGVLLVSGFSLYQTMRGAEDAYFELATMLLFFLLIGRYLDLRARGKARSAAEQLLRLTAQPASVVGVDGSVHRIPAASVKIGTTVLVAVGERIVVDGTVSEGRSSVDKSLIDGETVPTDVGTGAKVCAGMLNIAAPLRVAVTAVGAGTFLAEIVRLMEVAEHGRSRLVTLADRVARFYAPVVHSVAFLTFIGWMIAVGWQPALLNAVSVLIITCPCALGLAVPVVQVVASGRLMRRGILLKSATALERLAQIDGVCFDKTGTLTRGTLSLANHPAENDLRFASAMAASSRHALSQALRSACPGALPLSGVTEHPGEGLSLPVDDGQARLGSRRFCAIAAPDADGTPNYGSRGQAPMLCASSSATCCVLTRGAVVAALARDGKAVSLLSGDREAAVSAIARDVGIAHWQSEITPERKCTALADEARAGHRILMVGDGLNDAPALAAAFVSISPASGADVSQAAADAVFQGNSLSAVTELLRVARQSAALVRENIGFAILYNTIAVPLAIAGLVTPLLASVAMSASSLIVVCNALRLCARSR